MRVCIVYDCLFPWTVGGAERWYRSLAEKLASDGHEVTYLTRMQWPAEEPPRIAGVNVVAVSPNEPLYGSDGSRRTGQAIRFGLGVFRHLATHRDSYDVVHTCSFPYFSVLAAAAVRPFGSFELIVDWFEIWSLGYWTSYLGPVGGRIGYVVQRACIRVPQRPYCFSKRYAKRLKEEGAAREPLLVGGLYPGGFQTGPGRTPTRTVLFVGRLIPEKNAESVVDAIAIAQKTDPGISGLIVGDGPELANVRRRIEALGLGEAVSAPGFVPDGALADAMSSALCLAQPSTREGYGIVLVEAASFGTPCVVVEHPDNAGADLIESGTNGLVVDSSEPRAIAQAILTIQERGPEIRESTLAWFEANADSLSIGRSLERVAADYAGTA